MPDDPKAVIDRAWDEREAIGPATKGEVRQAVDAAIAALDSGEARIAEPGADGWTVHQWLKKAVLLSFRLNSMETISGWLVTGLAMGTLLLLAYRLVFRHQPELLLITTGTLAVLASIREGIQRMYPWALPGSFAGALLIATATWLWFRGSMKQSRS